MTGKTGARASANSLQRRPLNVDGLGAFAVVAEALSAGRELWLEASGESMYPTLPSGSRVLLVPRTRAPRAGDIVLVRRGDFLVLHRVRNADGHWVVTRGDACPTADPAVSAKDAIGLAVACEDDRGVRPLALTARWFGVNGVLRWARTAIHGALRGWRA